MTTWSFGGTDLSTFGKVTLIDNYMDFPPRRGENQVIPFQHGASFVQKFFDQRIITIGITIIGTSASDLETKIDTLMGLLAPRTEQVLSQTREDATVRTANASVDDSIATQRFSDKLAKCVINFTLSSPFFRLSTAISDNTTTINANPKAMTVTNPGTVEERNPTIILTGPLSNTVITNSTNGCVLTYTGTIASPRVVTITTNSLGEYIATNDLGANVIGNITHSGASALMVINKGSNTLSIADDTHTTGTVKISFYAPFI